MGLFTGTQQQYYEGSDGNQASNVNEYGGYQFISLKDLVNNFIINYVGEDKIISKIKRTDVAYHVRRGMQEFTYDVFRSHKSQEVEIPPNLQMPLPHDYVNYVKVTWVDDSGVERIVYPTRNTSNPLPLLQDSNYEYTFDNNGNLLTANESETWKRFKNRQQDNQDDLNDLENDAGLTQLFGRRYGIDPEYTQSNGVFFIDPIKNKIFFDASLMGKVITLKYISDGLATDEEMIVHKFAEEAVYKHVALSILSARANVPEYIINRFKKEKFATTRTAKLRLSNLKIEELTQVMRGKSKQIKH
jgi:virulence-associated protein VagC